MDIHETTLTTVAKASAKEIENELLKFFGSYENAKKYAHLYILEHREDVINESKTSISVTTTYRIRKKTKKELKDG